MRKVFLWLMLLHVLPAFSNHEIDSLKQLLPLQEHDTNRYKIYKQLLLKLVGRDYTEALAFSKLAHSIALEYPEKYDLSETYQYIGYCYSYLGKNDSAIYHLNKGLMVNNKPSPTKINIYNTLAGVYFDIGDYEKSVTHYLNAVAVSDQMHDTASAYKSYSQIANPYIELGYYDKAEEYLNKSIAYYQKQKDNRTLLALYNNLGNLYSYQERFEESIPHFERCLGISKEIQYKIGEAYSLSNLGESYRRMGKYHESLKCLLLSDKLMEKENFTFGMAGIKNSIGATYIKLKQYDQAEQYLSKALVFAKEQQLKRYIKSVYKDLAELYELQGNTIKALDCYKQFSNMKDSMYNEEKSKQIANSRIKFETEKIEQELKYIKDQKELQDLRIEQQDSKLRYQRYLNYGIVIATLVIVLIILLVFISYRYKQKAKYNELARNHLEISLRFLRSQLNPHFMFNSLSSIQGLILEKSISKANEYLGKFAILMRGVLENTSTSKILLSEELKNSELYLELEQMRHNNKFSFSIEMDKDIESDNLLIPPMILQPFLENAIKHGVSALSEDGIIKLYIYKNKDILVIEIIDNGVGLHAAGKQQSKQTHKSMGLQLVKDRLYRQYAQKEQTELLTFIDLSLQEQGKGTKVKLQIPIEEQF